MLNVTKITPIPRKFAVTKQQIFMRDKLCKRQPCRVYITKWGIRKVKAINDTQYGIGIISSPMNLAIFTNSFPVIETWIQKYVVSIPLGIIIHGRRGSTHWGRVTHICVSEIIIIGSDNGLSPVRHQAIKRTNAGILLIGTSGIKFNEIMIEINILSLQIMRLKMSSAKCSLFLLGLNELNKPSRHQGKDG